MIPAKYLTINFIDQRLVFPVGRDPGVLPIAWASMELFAAMFDPNHMTMQEWVFTQNTINNFTAAPLNSSVEKSLCCAKLHVWGLTTYRSFSFNFAPHALLSFLNCNVIFSEDVRVDLIAIDRTGWTVDALKSPKKRCVRTQSLWKVLLRRPPPYDRQPHYSGS